MRFVWIAISNSAETCEIGYRLDDIWMYDHEKVVRQNKYDQTLSFSTKILTFIDSFFMMHDDDYVIIWCMDYYD